MLNMKSDNQEELVNNNPYKTNDLQIMKIIKYTYTFNKNT